MLVNTDLKSMSKSFFEKKVEINEHINLKNKLKNSKKGLHLQDKPISCGISLQKCSI